MEVIVDTFTTTLQEWNVYTIYLLELLDITVIDMKNYVDVE
jgi:hypothetical protein